MKKGWIIALAVFLLFLFFKNKLLTKYELLPALFFYFFP